ncbi:MAG: hypothetical protein A2163_09425 [Actinobacteria bacterium RBG_13_35_12]|nr:MAG: hypothetical protein A2163_09425 [Actinobacteria bacterium RBG_13_35_12]
MQNLKILLLFPDIGSQSFYHYRDSDYPIKYFETFIFKNGRYIILKSSLKLLLNYYFFWRI